MTHLGKMVHASTFVTFGTHGWILYVVHSTTPVTWLPITANAVDTNHFVCSRGNTGADPGFSEGGSESGVDIEGGANRSISEAGGLGGAAPQKLWGR